MTIKNKENSIGIGNVGFMDLRRTIANLLSEEFGKLYKNWVVPCSPISDEEGNKMLKSFYDAGILTDNDDLIVEFLFASDVKGRLIAQGCKRLYELIKDYNDDIVYGCEISLHPAKFEDFKQIVRESAENNWIMEWRW